MDGELPKKRILVAGGTGQLGRLVVSGLLESGARVRTLSRRAEETALSLRARGVDVRLADATDSTYLAGVCDGVDVVCSCLGASVSMASRERRGFSQIDLVANQNLLAEARRAGVRRFVYVGAFVGNGWSHTAYSRAHEAFAEALKQSGLPYAVVRPTALFSVFAEMMHTARRAPLPLIGSGEARTNPIHDADVAALCLEAIRSPVPALEIDCGGEEILTRRALMEACFTVLGKKPWLLPVPKALMAGAARLAGLFNPRLGELLAFAAAVSTHECIAPARGRHRLADYLRERAAA
ncbi:Hypothetical protein A7982_11633 [Minicystis rosea]|nr:Hypothetical protein A7982_11633 [Minicystis rosea]